MPGTSLDFTARLRAAGLRPTRQRVALARLLFEGGHRHVTAESLHVEVKSAQMPVSLATVYNALNQFRDAGLLREVVVGLTDALRARPETPGAGTPLNGANCRSTQYGDGAGFWSAECASVPAEELSARAQRTTAINRAKR